MRHQHEPVTDSEHRNAERKNLWIDLRCAFVVNAGGSTGKDQPLRLRSSDFRDRCVETDDLRVHLALTDSSRYDLGILRAEIEDENFRVR